MNNKKKILSYSFHRLSNIWGCFPRKFNLICRLSINSFCLVINSINWVPILKTPSAWTFWKIIFEIPFKKWAIWIQPFSINNLSCSKWSYEFHSSCIEYICALTIFFPVFPFTRIYVAIYIFHYTFTIFFSVFPIPIIIALTDIVLFSNSMF